MPDEKTDVSEFEMISVIICTYNRSAMLKEAIDSVLAQSYPIIEIIVLDGNSPDNTSLVMKQYESNPSITYIRDSVDKGPQYYQKEGLRQSRGKYIVFMDDDDYYTDFEFFQKAVDVFHQYNQWNLAFVSGNVQKYNTALNKYLPLRLLNISGYIDGITYLQNFQRKYNKPISVFPTVFSRDALLKSGLLTIDWFIDTIIYMRALLVGGAVIIPDVIGIYRIHSANLTRRQTVEFTVSGLSEKKKIRDLIVKNNLFSNSDTWWFNLLSYNMGYYVLFTNPALSEYQIVKSWCIENSAEAATRVRMLLFILTLVLQVRRIFSVFNMRGSGDMC